VPAKAYWGIHTERARVNFPFSGNRTSVALIAALAAVKKAAAQTNQELGYLSTEKAAAIEQACDEVIAGRLADEFPLSALQGGAGTSTHMNVNEVIAHRASGTTGRPARRRGARLRRWRT
jgi:aspartate ammonia-lyase